MKLIKEIKSKTGEIHFRRWSIWTMVLWGGYCEEILNNDGSTKTGIRRFLNCGYRNSKRFHKIKSLLRVPAYTIAVVGKRKRDWGYIYNK